MNYLKSNKWIVTLIVILLLPLSFFGQTSQIQTFEGKQYVEIGNQWKVFDSHTFQYSNIVNGIVTIKYQAQETAGSISAFETLHQLTFKQKSATGFYDYDISGNSSPLFTLLNQLNNSPITEYVIVPSYGSFLAIPNDAQYGIQWHLPMISAPEAWNLTTGDPSVKIAIIDTGSDWFLNDLGTGYNTYQNIALNNLDVWTDANDPATGDGIDDEPNGKIDDFKGWNFAQNWNIADTNGGTNDSRDLHSTKHGTKVAGIIGAKTNNNTGLPQQGGQCAGVAGGWNNEGCKMLICSVGSDSGPHSWVVDNAITYAVDQGAKIIQLALKVPQDAAIEAAIQYAKDNNVVVICSSGNDNGNSILYPASNPYVISVGATTNINQRWEPTPPVPGNPGLGSNYGPKLDLAAPGENIYTSISNNAAAPMSGTSAASPIVSGVAGLMYSINPCLGARETKRILQLAADKVGAYDYNYDISKIGHSLEVGYGRVNAYQSVLAAQEFYSSTLDFYMLDTYDDSGNDAGYVFDWYFDNSPDIWVRKNNDGLVNQEHQSPEYQVGQSVYAYVRVGNKSCVNYIAANDDVAVDLYWNHGSTGSDYPGDWDGTNNPATGGFIGSVLLPDLLAGESTILEFEWPLTQISGVGTTWNNCLLARIENSAADPIVSYPGDLAAEIYYNNNVSLKNVTIENYINDLIGSSNEIEKFFNVGNPYSEELSYDIIFQNGINVPLNITEVAEVNVILDQTGWDLLLPYLQNRTDIRLKDNFTFSIVGNNPVSLNNVTFPENTQLPVKVAFHFLTDEMNEIDSYRYHVVQKRSAQHPVLGDHWTGGMHFYINKGDRDAFDADAGPDQMIENGNSTTLTAVPVSENATYNWYGSDGKFISSGQSITVSPTLSEIYKLEVIAEADRFMDVDEVEVVVNNFHIDNISPNPASNDISVDYTVDEGLSTYLSIVPISNGNSTIDYILDSSLSNINIDISGYASGIYTVVLIVNGYMVDAETLSIQ